MLLKVSLVIAAALSLVSCMNIGYMIQNIKNQGIHTMRIVDKEAGDMVKTVDKGAGDMVKTVDKGAGDIVKTVDKEAGDMVKTIDKGAGDMVKTVDKGAGDIVKTVDKGAGDMVKTVDKGAGDMVKTVDKGAGDMVKTVDKGAGDMVKTVDREAGNMVKTVKKEAGDIVKTFEKGEQILDVVGKEAANDLKTAEDVFMLLKTVHSNSSCTCVNYTCGCCLQIVVEKISLNETGCLNISYLPDEYGFEFLFTLNGLVIIDEKISVKNPPPICAAIPYIHQLASVCIRFYSLDYKEKQFSGCADIEVEVEGVVVKKYDLGCIHIPPSREHHFLTQVISQ